VFYELGVRHALADRVTILLRAKGTKMPFNIQDLKVIQYDAAHRDDKEVRKEISEFINNGLRAKDKDSPVHDVLNLKIISKKEPLKKKVFEYLVKNVPGKRIGIVTGDIRNVREADVWVNSENTNMEMARHYDNAVSSVIRYCGAVKDKGNRVTKDVIAEELAAIVGKNPNVAPGAIIMTSSGQLKESNGVKKIFHAAAVIGEPGKGYNPIQDLGQCVRNALAMADDSSAKRSQLKSILIPLMGTGTARGDLEPRAEELIEAAICYLEENPECAIERVYFSAWSDKELKVCQRILLRSPSIVTTKRMAAHG
jgi:O-acetyl-ADP-ribose deacetylase (regulator of RNase III)